MNKFPKKINTDHGLEDPFDAPKKYRCASINLGCNGIFMKESFRFSHHEQTRYERESTLCKECERRIGFEYGVNPLDALSVGTAIQNEKYYFEKIPGAQELDLKSKVRILLLASGVEIKLPSENEIRRSEILRNKYPVLAGVANVEKILKIV